MSFIYKLFQILLLVFNAFYFVIGLTAILSAITFNLNTSLLNQLIKYLYEYEYKIFIYGMLAYGFVLIIVGLLACYAILKKSTFLLILYFISLIVIFTLQFICCLCFYLKTNDYLANFLIRLSTLIKYEYNRNQFYTNVIDYIQQRFQCCGLKSPLDWYDSIYINQKYYDTVKQEERDSNANNSTISTRYKVITNSNVDYYLYKIPSSCCVNNELGYTCIRVNKYHEIGCENLIKIYYKNNEAYVIWLLAFLTVLQLVLLLLALYLLCISLIRSKKRNKTIRRSLSIASTSSSLSSSLTSIASVDAKSTTSVISLKQALNENNGKKAKTKKAIHKKGQFKRNIKNGKGKKIQRLNGFKEQQYQQCMYATSDFL